MLKAIRVQTWTRVLKFHRAAMLLGNICIQLFFFHLCINSTIDLDLYPWCSNRSKKRKTLNLNLLNTTQHVTFCSYRMVSIYIYNVRITMTRKTGKHLHATFGVLNSCFIFIRSHQQYTQSSPPLEIEPTTSLCRSRNSTTGPPVHSTYKRCQIIKSW